MAPFAPGPTSSRTHYLMAAQVEEHRRAEGRRLCKVKGTAFDQFLFKFGDKFQQKSSRALGAHGEQSLASVSKCCVSLIHLKFKFDRY